MTISTWLKAFEYQSHLNRQSSLYKVTWHSITNLQVVTAAHLHNHFHQTCNLWLVFQNEVFSLFLQITFIVLSSISSVLCTVGCITTGIHGTKIANYKFPCQGHKVCTCYYDSDDDITDGLANSTILYTTPIKKVYVSAEWCLPNF